MAPFLKRTFQVLSVRRVLWVGSCAWFLIGSSACGIEKIGQLEARTQKTTEDVDDLRSLQAQQESSIGQLRSELRSLSGKVEELEHRALGKTAQLEQTIERVSSRVPPPSGVPEELLNADEEQISKISSPAAKNFQNGLKLLRNGEFDAARQAFAKFVEENPDTTFSDNAFFWTGICYDKLGQDDRAIIEFSKVFQRYPAEDCVPAALYFLAQEFIKIHSMEDAFLTFEKLKDEHPESDFAAKAGVRLKEFKKNKKSRSR